jgi:RNA methyltransferase, RsmE family
MVVTDTSTLNYLSRVLRLRPGDEVEFFDGQGAARRARLQSLTKDQITGEWSEALSTVDPKVTLAPIPVLARLKSHAEDDAVSALAALGFPRIRIFQAERDATNKPWNDKQSQRWERIAEDSCRQSGGYWCTQIEEHSSLNQALEGLEHVVYGDSKGSSKIPPKGHHVGIVIGPEGGLSDAEKHLLERVHAQSIQLGQRTLRARHAASLLPAIVLSHWWSHA